MCNIIYIKILCFIKGGGGAIITSVVVITVTSFPASVRVDETGEENTLRGYKKDSKDQNKSTGTLLPASLVVLGHALIRW